LTMIICCNYIFDVAKVYLLLTECFKAWNTLLVISTV
jgi:hypothetical protein